MGTYKSTIEYIYAKNTNIKEAIELKKCHALSVSWFVERVGSTGCIVRLNFYLFVYCSHCYFIQLRL